MTPCEAWFIMAVCHALNPTVWAAADGTLYNNTDRGAVAIGRHSEGAKFYFKLSCGQHHSLSTMHAITSEAKLLCRACEPAAGLAAARVQPFTTLEHTMHIMHSDAMA